MWPLEGLELLYLAPCQNVRALKARYESCSSRSSYCPSSPARSSILGVLEKTACPIIASLGSAALWWPKVAMTTPLVPVPVSLPLKERLTGLKVASKDKPPPKQKILVVASQTSDTSSRVSNLGVLQLSEILNKSSLSSCFFISELETVSVKTG